MGASSNTVLSVERSSYRCSVEYPKLFRAMGTLSNHCLASQQAYYSSFLASESATRLRLAACTLHSSPATTAPVKGAAQYTVTCSPTGWPWKCQYQLKDCGTAVQGCCQYA
jgi:hypothetical protein